MNNQVEALVAELQKKMRETESNMKKVQSKAEAKIRATTAIADKL